MARPRTKSPETQIYFITHRSGAFPVPRVMSRAVPSGRREGMFPGRYSDIFGLGERLGYILNLGHSFDAIEAYL